MLLRAKGKKTYAPEGASYIFCKRKHCHFLYGCYHSQSGPCGSRLLYVLLVWRISDWLRISAATEFLFIVSFKVMWQLVWFFKEKTMRFNSSSLSFNEVIFFFHILEFLANIKNVYLINPTAIPSSPECSYMGPCSVLYASSFQKKSPFSHPRITNPAGTAKQHNF